MKMSLATENYAIIKLMNEWKMFIFKVQTHMN